MTSLDKTIVANPVGRDSETAGHEYRHGLSAPMHSGSSEEIARLRTFAQRGSDGGDFFRTTLFRVDRRFARALLVNALEWQMLYRDAFRMLGVSMNETFNNLRREVGVMG